MYLYFRRILTSNRRFLQTRWRRSYNKLTMPNEKALPDSLSGCFVFGVGLGTGIAIVVYVTKRFLRQERDNGLVLALKEISSEICELRGVLVTQDLQAKTASSLSRNETQKSLFPLASIKDKLPTGQLEHTGDVKADESTSSDDEDFFEVQEEEDENNRQIPNGERVYGVDMVIRECDELFDQNDAATSEREIKLLENLLITSEENVEVLWRLGRAYKNKASVEALEDDPEIKKDLIKKGIEYIEKAVTIDENSGDAHKWYAILLGLLSEHEAVLKEKIYMAHRFKEHITTAIRLKPDDPTVYYLMGRWSYEVAMLPWWQRQAAATFIANPPTATFEEALSHFDEYEKLSPMSFKPNILYIGKCYQQLGDRDKAREWMNKSLELPVKDDEDKKAAEEATALLQSL